MAEQPVVNGLDDVPVKTEPTDPLDSEPPVIPKEFTVSNGIHEDSDCEDISYFTQVEVDNTRKCLENTKLIIKDFETQLDWHLQQYMTLRNIFNTKKNSKDGKDDGSKRQDLLSISQLSAIIANHPEGNKKFIKRKGPIPNGTGGRKRRKNKDSESEEEEESDFSDEDSEEFDEEDFDMGGDSEDEDDPGAAKKTKRGRGKKAKADEGPQVKDEIEEEVHELIEPKEEMPSDDEEMMDYAEFEPKKTPAKRGRKPKGEEAKTPAKKGARGKKGKNSESVDLTNIKNCKVVLNRMNKDGDEDDDDIEIKEEIEKDDLVEMLKEKAITSLENFSVDAEKPIAILKDDNVKAFDFNECKTSNVIVTFEDSEAFPEFIFVKNVTDQILDGSIILVHANVFDQHLEKN